MTGSERCLETSCLSHVQYKTVSTQIAPERHSGRLDALHNKTNMNPAACALLGQRAAAPNLDRTAILDEGESLLEKPQIKKGFLFFFSRDISR